MIYWIRHTEPPRMAIVARPRGDGWLERDVQNLKNGGIEVLVSLLTPPEATELGVSGEQAAAEESWMEFVSYPIPDRTVPADLPGFSQFIAQLTDVVGLGHSVGVHCRASIGRSTMVTAAMLVNMGMDAERSLTLIEEARGYPVPDTMEQREWIRHLRRTR